jgi:hypothetical protein
VPEVLLAETRSFLEKRGYAVVSGGTVESMTHGNAPATVEDAARLVPSQARRRRALHRDPALGLSVDQSTAARGHS